MKTYIYILLSFIIFHTQVLAKDDASENLLRLWYQEPALVWDEALPIGNGRLGAMIYGGVAKDAIQFNEETLWTGQPHDYARKDAYKQLNTIRQYLNENNQSKAHQLANAKFMSTPIGQQAYQPFGNILLEFPDHTNATNYQRDLSLSDALATVSYQVGTVSYKREFIASAPDNAIIIHLSASQNAALNFTVGMDCPHISKQITVEGKQRIVLSGKANNYTGKPNYPSSKINFESILYIENEGGELITEGNKVKVSNATNVTLKLVAATSFVNYHDISADPHQRCTSYLDKIIDKDFAKSKQQHIQDYSQFFDRVTIDLGHSALSQRPTDKRLDSFNTDEDPHMISLLYQYARYLLIATSRHGTQPANLQGIWNDKLSPPWESKYTININTEMNYWLSEMTNLSELSEPLFQMVKDISETGRGVAKEHYNARGWVTHHNTDLWRGAAPINNANHGIWVTGGAWLSQHLWTHYEYTHDKAFLEEFAYPILKEASLFFVDFLVPDQKNPSYLISGPSNSPEQGGLVMGPTMDHQIIRDLFSNTIESAQLLKKDKDLVALLKEKRSKISPNKIGRHGQLQEWTVDKDNPKNQHRHVSHLWGLHPGREIHPLTTPKLAEACKVTLAHRGDAGTGWSRGWKINFWARLLDGDHTFLMLKSLIVPAAYKGTDKRRGGGLYYNMLCAHPPFQIDGNFGATSGITEMLLQSHLRDENNNYFQDILPALPTALAQGEITGIKGRGGFEFSIKWKNNTLEQVEVTSLYGSYLNLRYKGKVVSRKTKKGKKMTFVASDFK